MKTFMIALMMLVSISAMADKPDCEANPDFPACNNRPQGIPPGLQGDENEIFAVSEPSTLALLGIGLAGIALSRKHLR